MPTARDSSDGVGLFPEPARVDWNALGGRRTSVRMSWGDSVCIIRGLAQGGDPPGVMVELLADDGVHEHDGKCTLVTVSSILVRVPPATAPGPPAR